MSELAFDIAPFTPHPLMRNSHIQTLAGRWFRNDNGIPFRRVRLDTPDGDFIDLDFADVPGHSWAALGDEAPIFLLLHGLEGCAKTGYAHEIYRLAAAADLRPVGMNFRSCSGELNRKARFYHMGATGDVALVHDYLEDTFGGVPLVIAGVSLGGNMLLKYLGEGGDAMASRVTAAVAISSPFVATGRQAINHGAGRLYGMYLLQKLKAKVQQKARLIAQHGGDVVGALESLTLRQFDVTITAPLHGFADADDYYATNQSVNFLADIRVPTLLMRALDDPFFNNDIPYDIIQANPHLVGHFPAYGGHVGFIEGTTPANHSNWALRQAVRFFTVQVAG